MELLHTIRSHNTALVHASDARPLGLALDDSRVHDLFHHGLLCRIAIALTYEIGASNLGEGLTRLIVATLVTLR